MHRVCFGDVGIVLADGVGVTVGVTDGQAAVDDEEEGEGVV